MVPEPADHICVLNSSSCHGTLAPQHTIHFTPTLSGQHNLRPVVPAYMPRLYAMVLRSTTTKSTHALCLQLYE